MSVRLRPVPYVSPACHIGRHPACDKGGVDREAAPIPGVRREACACHCHQGGAPGRHQVAGSFAGTENTVPSGAAA